MNEWKTSHSISFGDITSKMRTTESIDGQVDQTSLFVFDNSFDSQLDPARGGVGHRELLVSTRSVKTVNGTGRRIIRKTRT